MPLSKKVNPSNKHLTDLKRLDLRQKLPHQADWFSRKILDTKV